MQRRGSERREGERERERESRSNFSQVSTNLNNVRGNAHLDVGVY